LRVTKLSLFKQSVFGIDISDYSVELLALEQAGDGYRAVSYSRKFLLGGIIDAGVVKNPKELSNVLKVLVSGAEPVPPQGNKVAVSLPSQKTFSHVFSLPTDLKDSEFKAAVANEAKKLIPLEEGSYYFDYYLGAAHNNTQEVVYAACEKQVVDDMNSVLEIAGLQPTVFGLEEESTAYALLSYEKQKVPVCIIDVGARKINVIIHEDGAVRFSSTIFFGGLQVTNEISKNLGVLPEKAEAMKREVGFDPEREDGRVLLALQKSFQPLLTELSEILSYYKSKSSLQIKKGYLVGGGSLTPGFVDYLNANSSITFSFADPWDEIDTSLLSQQKDNAEFHKIDIHPVFFTNVIGLALKAIQSDDSQMGINLLPKKSGNSFGDVIHKIGLSFK